VLTKAVEPALEGTAFSPETASARKEAVVAMVAPVLRTRQDSPEMIALKAGLSCCGITDGNCGGAGAGGGCVPGTEGNGCG
jgi:hypothetical protein